MSQGYVDLMENAAFWHVTGKWKSTIHLLEPRLFRFTDILVCGYKWKSITLTANSIYDPDPRRCPAPYRYRWFQPPIADVRLYVWSDKRMMDGWCLRAASEDEEFGFTQQFCDSLTELQRKMFVSYREELNR